MNKSERKAYIISKLKSTKHLEDFEPVDGVINPTPSDIEDELSINDSFREHQRTTEKELTSDEQ